MTRINLVEPKQLINMHLIAEYKEITRIFTAVLKLQTDGKTPSDVDIPDHYILGTGHMKFFYNKISWIRIRYEQIKNELLERGYDLDLKKYELIVKCSYDIDPIWNGDLYKPTPEEIYLNMIRICKRSKIPSVIKEMES